MENKQKSENGWRNLGKRARQKKRTKRKKERGCVNDLVRIRIFGRPKGTVKVFIQNLLNGFSLNGFRKKCLMSHR